MKILNLIWKFGTGGIAKCFETYARLGECDSSVHVMSVCIDPQCFDYDRRRLEELGVICIKTRTTLDFSWHKSLAKIVKDYNPNVVFTHGFHGPMIYLTTSLLHHLHTPLVASYHGLYYAPTKAKKWLAPIINHMTILMYKYCCKRVVAVSFYSKRELERLGVKASKVSVVHNGIKDIPIEAETKNQSDVVRIGVVSRLDPFKGIDVLIEALSEVKKHTKYKFYLDIVGNGPMNSLLREKVSKCGLDNEVAMLGYRSDVAELMRSWDVFCLPTFFENHSIAILEAMRAGKAIVATDVGGNSESVRNKKEALLAPAKDAENLAQAILQIIDDTSLREKLGRNARMRFEQEFTEHVMMEKLIKSLTL